MLKDYGNAISLFAMDSAGCREIGVGNPHPNIRGTNDVELRSRNRRRAPCDDRSEVGTRWGTWGEKTRVLGMRDEECKNEEDDDQARRQRRKDERDSTKTRSREQNTKIGASAG